jgi:sulfite dehydrogenase (cytochrome) subunit B
VKVLAAGLLLLALAAGSAGAQDKRITLPADSEHARLKPGPGVEVAQSRCQACHSTDYIVMQPRGDARQWGGVVTKMIKVFGAPVSEADAKVITEYLAGTYGPAR